LYGDDLSCCYFDNAADRKIIDPRKPVSQVVLFKGGEPGAACSFRMNAWARFILDSTIAETD
jgi:hypothetical protein